MRALRAWTVSTACSMWANGKSRRAEWRNDITTIANTTGCQNLALWNNTFKALLLYYYCIYILKVTIDNRFLKKITCRRLLTLCRFPPSVSSSWTSARLKQTTPWVVDWPLRSRMCAEVRTAVWASMKPAGALCWVWCLSNFSLSLCKLDVRFLLSGRNWCMLFLVSYLPQHLTFVLCYPGPMVYGICFCPISKKDELKNLKVAGKINK